VLAKPEPGGGLPKRSKPSQRAHDALDQLRRDHDLVRKLLRDYDRLRQGGAGGPEGKAEIVARLCDALILCALIEEEVFYPTVRLGLGGKVLEQTTFCDHARLRSLIAGLDEMEPEDSGYDDAVADISDCVLPCLHDAQSVLFVEVRMAGLDTAALGEQMAQRRRAQQQQDFTRIGLPASESTAALGGWPPACRLVPM
jgi:hypothetical protein